MPSWLTDFWSAHAQVITSIVVIIAIIHVILVAAMYLILLERKICAWVQDRIGPNRVGPMGLLQPVADGLKLFVKEDFVPAGADRALFLIAPGLTVIPALISFAVIPWAGVLSIGGQTVKIVGADVNIGVIYLVAVASLGVYGVALGGWASNSKYSFLGGLRASAQMVSYEIPMGLALLAIILTAGSLMPYEIIAKQLHGQWFIIHQPLAAIVFYTCMLAEANRLPFDLAESESELVGGWHTEYSSMSWALFFLGEYGHIFAGSAFFTMLFLGGWSINPFTGHDLPAAGGVGLILLQAGVVFTKTFILICLTLVLRWTLPRFRYDQLMRLAWEGMIPTGLLIVMVTSVFVYLGWTQWMFLGSIASMIIIWIAHPLLPRQANPNHKLPLIGSRFSPMRENEPVGRGA